MKTTIRFLAVALIACAPPAAADDLRTVFELAIANDPVYREAEAAYRATLEARPQARALLLPDVRLSANTRTNDQDISLEGGFGVGGEIDFNSHGYSLDITQPVVRADRFLRYQQADSRIAQAAAELELARQDLILRLSQRYFDVLAAIDNLEFARAEKRSLSRQLEQAKQRFDVGLTAITDVQEAQAGYDRAVAEEITAENALDNAREALREITGEYHAEVEPLGSTMPLVSPTPNDIEQWTATALDENLQIVAAEHALETASQEIKVQQAGHLPSLDLVASRGYEASGGRFGGTQLHATSIGLELNVPLFQGGLVNSLTREARERHTQALERLTQAKRSTQRQTREAFLGVLSGISRVQALQQAVVSSETALEATNAGFEVGTRTAVDVVAAERALSDARRNYARARYEYILNSLELKQAAGILMPADLQEINNWLE
jgi:outer membrane protein